MLRRYGKSGVGLMCFSPEADITAGTAVAVVGIDSLLHVSSPRQLPLALMPLLLAAHELDEAFVWWGLRGQVAWSVGHAAVVIYLTFAFCLPAVVPLAVMAIEINRSRRAIMGGLAVVGIGVSVVLLTSVFRGTVSARIDGHHIAYTATLVNGTLLAFLYVLSTCGGLLASSERRIVVFGLSNILAVIVLAWLTIGGLTSLWCAWAAVASAAIALYLRAAGGAPPRWPSWRRPRGATPQFTT